MMPDIVRNPEIVHVGKSGSDVLRKTANKIIKEFLARVQEVNASPDYVYKITKVIAFGSYINSEKEKLGDIDLAVELGIKSGITEKEIKEANQKFLKLRLKQNSSINWFNQMYLRECGGKEEILSFLKGKRRSISLHDLEQNLEVVYKHDHLVIYPEQ